MSEVVLVSIPNVVTSGHWAVPTTEHIISMTIRFVINVVHGRGIVNIMVIVGVHNMVNMLVGNSMAIVDIGIHNRSIFSLSVGLVNIISMGRPSINILDIMFDLWGMLGKSMSKINISVHSRSVVHSLSIGVNIGIDGRCRMG